MSGFINPDGSQLVGGQLPSGQGQALQFDGAGNLKMTPSSGGAANLPLITEANISTWIRNGQGFVYSAPNPGNVASGNTGGVSVFNPSATKNILIYSIMVFYLGGSVIWKLSNTTADPALTAGSSANQKLGGPASIASTTYSVNTAVAGTVIDYAFSWSNMQGQFNNVCYVLPANAGQGLAAYFTSAGGGQWEAVFKGIEF